METMSRLLSKLNFLGNQVHLKSLRDANAITMSLAILAGFMVLINSMVLDPTGILSGVMAADSLINLQQFGQSIINATLGIWGLAASFMVAYCLARNKEYEEPVIAAMVSLVCFVTLTPLTINIVPIGAEQAVKVSSALTQTYTGTTGLFTAMIVGLLSTEIFMRLSKLKKLTITMPEMVPPMVAKSFSALLPFMIVVITFGMIAFGFQQWFHMSVNEIVVTLIQTPIKGLTTSLPGFLMAMIIFNLIWAIGIHPSAIVGAIIDPILLLATTENMAAVANGLEAPNIINTVFKDSFGLMGGTGSTICLIIAVFVFSKRKDYKTICSLGVGPGLFNINEPILFGFPIVMNPIMVIPFVGVTTVSYIIAYGATTIGLIEKSINQVPWTTPPLISQYLATNGDWRAVLLQAGLIVLGVLIYLPFLKISERATAKDV